MNPLADSAADACGGPTPLQSLARGVEADALEYLQERWELPTRPQFDFEREIASESIVQQCLSDFLHATMMGKRLELPEISATVPPGDSVKFLNRLSMLSRHTTADPILARTNMETLIHALHISTVPLASLQQQNPVERPEEWSVGEHGEAFERAWTATDTSTSWAHEYGANGSQTLTHQSGDQLSSLEQAWNSSREVPLESAWTEATGNADVSSTKPTTVEDANESRLIAAGIASSAAGQDEVIGQTQFMQFMKQLGNGTLKVDGNRIVSGDQTESEQIDDELRKAELAALDQNSAFHEDGSAALDSWRDEFEDESVAEAVTAEQTAQAAEIARGYSFSAASLNPFVAHSNPFAKAQDLYKDGETAQAVLACEAELMRSPSNADAWKLLGLAQAQNDNDQQACIALDAAHRLRPNDLETIMSLAVGMTNDLHKDEAVSLLREWLAQHPIYNTINPPPVSEVERFVAGREGAEALSDPEFRAVADSLVRIAQVIAMFDAAAHSEHGRTDADIHVALGLLHTLSYDFSGASEAFRVAVTLRPGDEKLWNKLGATLANDNRNQEAVDAYTHALQIRPTYLRAHSNLGIALLGLNRPQESACCFLRALSLDPSAEHLWDSLRIVFHQLNRPDLNDKIALHDPEFFRDDFDF